MAYAARQSVNAGGSGVASFGYGVDIAGLLNAETLKVAGVTVFGGVGSLTTFVQTYSTADVTVPNATYAAPTQTANTLVLTATAIAAKTASLTLIDLDNTNAASVADTGNQNFKDVGTAINTANVSLASTNTQLAALAADVLILKKLINSLIDIDQANGFAA